MLMRKLLIGKKKHVRRGRYWRLAHVCWRIFQLFQFSYKARLKVVHHSETVF